MKNIIIALSLVSMCGAAEKIDTPVQTPKKPMKYVRDDINPDTLDIYIFDLSLPKRKQKVYRPSNRSPHHQRAGTKVVGK